MWNAIGQTDKGLIWRHLGHVNCWVRYFYYYYLKIYLHMGQISWSSITTERNQSIPGKNLEYHTYSHDGRNSHLSHILRKSNSVLEVKSAVYDSTNYSSIPITTVLIIALLFQWSCFFVVISSRSTRIIFVYETQGYNLHVCLLLMQSTVHTNNFLKGSIKVLSKILCWSIISYSMKSG